MKLFLSSAGIKPETKDKFLELLGKDPKQCTVAFVPTACDPEPDKSYVQWTIDQIEELGMKCVTIDLKGESASSLYEKMKDTDVICMNGGNSFYLLDWVKKSGFDTIVRKLLDEGKIYFGVSAGSLIACPDIALSGWKKGWDANEINLKDTTGLGLIDYVISPHYKPSDKEVLDNYAKTSEFKVVPLTDQEVIIING